MQALFDEHHISGLHVADKLPDGVAVVAVGFGGVNVPAHGLAHGIFAAVAVKIPDGVPAHAHDALGIKHVPHAGVVPGGVEPAAQLGQGSFQSFRFLVFLRRGGVAISAFKITVQQSGLFRRQFVIGGVGKGQNAVAAQAPVRQHHGTGERPVRAAVGDPNLHAYASLASGGVQSVLVGKKQTRRGIVKGHTPGDHAALRAGRPDIDAVAPCNLPGTLLDAPDQQVLLGYGPGYIVPGGIALENPGACCGRIVSLRFIHFV